MALDVGVQTLPDLIAGVGMLALAALLLWVAPTNRVHRAFALLQVVNGGGSLVYVGMLGVERSDPLLAVVLANFGTYFILAWPFAAAFFTLRYLDPEGRSRVSRPLAWGLLIGVAGTLVAFAFDHGLYSSRRALGIVWYGRPLTFGAMALLFALGARRTEDAPRRDGLVLASAAFMGLAVLGAVWRFVSGSPTVDGFTALPAGHSAISLVARALTWAGALSVGGTITAVLLVPPLRGDVATHTSRRMLIGTSVLSGLSALVTIRLLAHDPVAFTGVGGALDGVWRVVMTMFLAYALLRRQLFDVKVKLRFAISRSTVAAIFIAVFFVASEAAQQFFGETLGSAYVGIATAGALVFAIAPLQRAAERLAEKAVPFASDALDDRSRQEAAYQAAVRLALRGGITRAEEIELARIAEAHGLEHVRALELRSEVEDASAQEERP